MSSKVGSVDPGIHNETSPLMASLIEEDHCDDYDDSPEDMTYSRRAARYLSKFSWYFPGKRKLKDYESRKKSGSFGPEEKVPPSLDSAWAYFEHMVLPRYDVKDDPHTVRQSIRASIRDSMMPNYNNPDDEYPRSVAGSKGNTRLYPVYKTGNADLADFGMGVGLYFFTLKALAVIMFTAGCINIHNMIYFASEQYVSDGQASIFKAVLKGSAICTDETWEACPTCKSSDWHDYSSSHLRYAESLSDPSLTFIKVNHCKIEKLFGDFSVATLLFIFMAFFTLNKTLKVMEVKYDLCEQTASDYSLVVTNPPEDAYNPEDWKKFFEQVDVDNDIPLHVTLCTVVLKNDKLVNALVKRRELLLQIQNRLPLDVKFDPDNLEEIIDKCNEPSWVQKKILGQKSSEEIHWNIREVRHEISKLTVPESSHHVLEKLDEVRREILKLTTTEQTKEVLNSIEGVREEISALSGHEKRYPVSSIYVTFETEQARDSLMKKITTSIFAANNQKIPRDYSKRCLFQGKHVLKVEIPDEPDSIRWTDFVESDMQLVMERTFTFVICLIVLIGSAVLIIIARYHSAAAASITITSLNIITPRIAKKVTSFESHKNHSTYETSQFIKIAVIRWFNTAIVTRLVTPFCNTLSNGPFMINYIFAINISEMLINPGMQILNIASNIQRHILGPRAVDQRRMNLNFKGASYNIGERYTLMTKVVFFTLFYGTIFPLGFFLGTLTLFITYWTDKYCLLRQWQAAPKIGASVSTFTRKYFFSLAVVIYAVVAMNDYAGFPFDNACVTDQSLTSKYVGSHIAKDLNGKSVEIEIKPNATTYKFCFQDTERDRNTTLLATPKNPPEKREWMNPDQATLFILFSWVSFGAVCTIGIKILFYILKEFRPYFFAHYKPHGDITAHKFSDQDQIHGYVPQLKIPGYQFPVLMCEVDDGIGQFVGWENSANPSYDNHNMVFDLERVRKKIACKRKFSLEMGEQVSDHDEHHLFSIIKHWDPKP